MDCKLVQQDLSAFVDGTLGARRQQAIEEHLNACENCTRELQWLHLILDSAATLSPRSATDSLWTKIANELESQAPRPAVRWRHALSARFSEAISRITVPVPVSQLLGIAAVLLFGVILGRYFFPPTGPEAPPFQKKPGQVQLTSRADTYIEKSKTLFLGIMNADLADLTKSDWKFEKEMAGSLIYEAAHLKEEYSRKQDARMKELVEGLEMLLLQIAMLENQNDLKEVELIQSGIERKNLLLRINLYDLAPPQDKRLDRSL